MTSLPLEAHLHTHENFDRSRTTVRRHQRNLCLSMSVWQSFCFSNTVASSLLSYSNTINAHTSLQHIQNTPAIHFTSAAQQPLPYHQQHPIRLSFLSTTHRSSHYILLPLMITCTCMAVNTHHLTLQHTFILSFLFNKCGLIVTRDLSSTACGSCQTL